MCIFISKCILYLQLLRDIKNWILKPAYKNNPRLNSSHYGILLKYRIIF